MFAVQKTKVLLLLCEDFSAEASVGAHANTCSVKECHWERERTVVADVAEKPLLFHCYMTVSMLFLSGENII